MPNARDLLMGGGVPGAKFATVGDSVSGIITTEPVVQQQRDYASGDLLTWDDGAPREQIKVVLDTGTTDPEVEDDDGCRALYLKGGLMTAVRQAVRRARAPELEAGGRLTVTYTADGEVTKRGFNPPKVYTAEYLPPADEPAGEDDSGDIPF